MRRLIGFALGVALLCSASATSAIQLHWADGSTNLNFSEHTRAILVVKADSTDFTLPGAWTLEWLADSSGVNVVAVDSLTACATDTARAASVDPPITPADSAAHQVTAHFCADRNSATTAYFLLDQPGASKGRMKVVAIDPTDPDSSRVIESGEVTYNGGVDGAYSPTVLRATSVHQSEELQVTLVGSGLENVRTLSVGATDGLWVVPLTITTQSDASVTASAQVPAQLPASVILLEDGAAMSALAPLAGEEVATVDASLPDTILYRDPDPNMYPKDFAFYYNTVPNPGNAQHPWKGLFHLIYIRANRVTKDDFALAHAWSEDLRSWRVNTSAFAPSGVSTAWDDLHTWAPSIIPVGDRTYMFYTGVDANNNQRIGYAWTSLLDTTDTAWHRSGWAVYSAGKTQWADSTAQGYLPPVQQFRDPWIMTDPDHPNQYLLFMVGEDKNYGSAARNVVGIARNVAGTLDQWTDLGPYRATDYSHTRVTQAESPLVCKDSSGTGPWRIYFANANYVDPGYKSTYFATEAIGSGVADTTLGNWPSLDSLYYYLGNNVDVAAWQACEHLQVGKVHLFAAYQGDGIGITRTYWNNATHNFVIGYPDLTGVGDGPSSNVLRFYVADLHPGASMVRFVLNSPDQTSPRVAVYDLAGRKVRTLGDGRPVRGTQAFQWDCRDREGLVVPTGIYFACLTGAGRPMVVRVPIVH